MQQIIHPRFAARPRFAVPARFAVTCSAVFAATAFLLAPPLAHAQQSGPGWFVPGQAPGAQGGSPRPAPALRAAPAPRAAPAVAAPLSQPPDGAPPEQAQLGPEVPLPPLPELPPLPRGSSPPAAVIGVLGVPEIMRSSAASQQIQKIVGERRQKLNDDAQKEQAIWRDMQQSLANDRTKLTPDQIRGRERELQDRITNAQRSFRERNQVVQEAAQFAFAQVERSLIAVIRQVAEAHGMNLVLHRAQVALNVNEFDITDQVASQLNTILPAVLIPPDGQAPADFVKQHPFPAMASVPAPPAGTTPAATPAAASPTPAGGAPGRPAPGPATPGKPVP